MPDFISEPYSDAHDATGFDSGERELDDWLRKSARDSDGRNITRTTVWHEGDGIVVAYYTVMPYTIDAADLTKRQRRGLPSRIPCYLLARLALERRRQDQRIGSVLLGEALVRLANVAEQAGGRFVIVDALNERAVSFYVHHGFEPMTTDPPRLLLRLKDVTANL